MCQSRDQLAEGSCPVAHFSISTQILYNEVFSKENEVMHNIKDHK